MIPIPIEETLAFATLRPQTPHHFLDNTIDLDNSQFQALNISLKASQNLEL